VRGLGYWVCKKACVKGLGSAGSRRHCGNQDLSHLIGTVVGEAGVEVYVYVYVYAIAQLVQARLELNH
jgi:hypothetical protein